MADDDTNATPSLEHISMVAANNPTSILAQVIAATQIDPATGQVQLPADLVAQAQALINGGGK